MLKDRGTIRRFLVLTLSNDNIKRDLEESILKEYKEYAFEKSTTARDSMKREFNKFSDEELSVEVLKFIDLAKEFDLETVKSNSSELIKYYSAIKNTIVFRLLNLRSGNGGLSAQLNVLQPNISNYLDDKINNLETKESTVMYEYTPVQTIYAGPPGTGKSYGVKQFLKQEEVEMDNISRVTFYPDYEYHNFIGSILPVLEEGVLCYKFVPGPFTTLLKKALDNPSEVYYLVIEEMTRGNAASIFGDVFQLLDRNENGESEYPINNKFIGDYISEDFVVLPNNFNILATINTSDQNVFVLDTAFKRRFDFKYVSTEIEDDNFQDFNITFNNQAYSWREFYPKLNNFILNDLNAGEDKQLGPYFISKNDSVEKLLMYLHSDVSSSYVMANNVSLFASQYQNSLMLILKDYKTKDVFSEEFKNSLEQNEN